MKSMKPLSHNMNIVTNVSVWRNQRAHLANKKIAFVPTMGNLHEGHISLCERAKAENDIVVVSIFINPNQFNDKKDFDLYPRTLDDDLQLLQAHNIDYVFLPDAEEIYADQYQTKVVEDDISIILEGKYRPGHFAGVLTVVLKLFNIIQPARAYFGEKDFQQLLLIQKMVSALFLPIEIIPCPTLRDENGLALSSRNSRLSDKERQTASNLYRLLCSHLTPHQITDELTNLGFQVDYIVEKWRRRLGVVYLNQVRLIDNVPWHD